MPEINESDWPIEQQSYPSGALISEAESFCMQIQDEEGRWMGPFGGIKTDRAEMTRVQAYRAQHPMFEGEKRRIVRRVLLTWVDEVEGDGEGETSRDALLARNDETTARLLAADEEKKTALPNGQTLEERLGSPEQAP